MGKIFTIILGLFSLIIIAIFIISLMKASPEVIASIIAGVFILAGAVWGYHSTKRLDISSRHFIEKKTAYMHFIKLILDLFRASQKKRYNSRRRNGKAFI